MMWMTSRPKPVALLCACFAVIMVMPSKFANADPKYFSRIEAGVYGNVRESPLTGDLNGLEVQISTTNKTIASTLCEGWCNRIDVVPYNVRVGSTFYSVREKLTDQNGRISYQVIKFELKPHGRDVLAKVSGDGRWSMLTRLPRRYGLRIAAGSMKASGAE